MDIRTDSEGAGTATYGVVHTETWRDGLLKDRGRDDGGLFENGNVELDTLETCVTTA